MHGGRSFRPQLFRDVVADLPIGDVKGSRLKSQAWSATYFVTLLASILIDGSSSLVLNAVSTANGFSMPR